MVREVSPKQQCSNIVDLKTKMPETLQGQRFLLGKKIAHRATISYPFLGFPTTEQHERQDEDCSSFIYPGVYGPDVWSLPSSYLTECKAAARWISVFECKPPTS